MTIYEDYTSWKEENSSLIQELIKLKSPIITRIIHVLAVIDYLNNQYYNQGGLDNDSEVIFETGFDYITNHFITISTILQKEFRGNLIQMNQIAKTINLLLYTNDFQKELEYSDDYSESDKEKLNDFEQKVLSYIDRHEECPDEMFGLLNDITFDIFDSNYRSINDIMYDIAIELDLVPNPDNNEAIDNIFGIKANEL